MMTEDHTEPLPRALPPAAQALALSAPALAPAPRARGRRSVYVLALLVLVIAGAIGYAAGAWNLRTESHYMLMDALRTVRQADADVAEVGAVVETGLTAEGGGAARGAQPVAKRARQRLQRALDLVRKAEPDLKDDDRLLAAVVRQQALGRLGMLAAAAELLPLQARAGDARNSAESAWESVARAAEFSDRAALQFNKHTEDGVGESTILTARAESELASASAELALAARAMPEAKLGPIVDYVEQRWRLAQESRRVDGTWLSGRVDEANRLLAELSVREAPLDARIRTLPKTAVVPVTVAYGRLSQKATAAYRRAQQLALAGDARLREIAASQPSE